MNRLKGIYHSLRKIKTVRLKVEYELLKCWELRRMYSQFKKYPESQWIIGKDDALNLYKLILKNKPQKILECGTGIGASTAVMALALKKLGAGNIISLEQSQKCAEIAKSLIDA